MELLRHNANRAAVLTRRASVRAESANAKASTIEVVLATEDPVAMFDYDSWMAIDEILLSGGREIAAHVPLLDAHDRDSISKVLGHIEDIRTADGGTDTVAVAHFDADDPNAVTAFRKYLNKHAKDISVGYTVRQHMTVQPGESAVFGDRTFTASALRPLRVAVKWTVNEGSLVPIGADARAKARGGQAGVTAVQISIEELNELMERQRKQSPEVAVTDGVSKDAAGATGGTERSSDMSSPTVTSPAAPKNDPAAGTVVENREDAIREGVKLEAKRRVDIQAAAEGVRAEVVTACLDDTSCTLDQARQKFLADLQGQRTAPAAGADAPNVVLSGNRHARDCNPTSLGLAVAMRMGAGNVDKLAARMQYDPFTGQLTFERNGVRCTEDERKEHERNCERADKFRRIHSVDLCREALQMEKVEAPIERRSLVTRAMSTPTVSTIYTTAMGAVLLANLGDMTDSTEGWVNEFDAKSFKNQELHRIEGGRLRRRNRGEAAKQATFVDSMETMKVYDFAETLILDRQDLVDDELGAWKKAMDEYARAILSVRPDLVYALLMSNPTMATDSTALFHANHANLVNVAFNAANLEAGMSAVASQRNGAGVPLQLQDLVVIVAQTKRYTALTLAQSVERSSSEGTLNPIKLDNLQVQSDSRINTGFNDPVTETAIAAAANTWFLAAKNGAYGVQVGYLEGSNRMPTMSSTLLNSEGRYGIALDVQHTCGAGVGDFQGLYRSNGG